MAILSLKQALELAELAGKATRHVRQSCPQCGASIHRHPYQRATGLCDLCAQSALSDLAGFVRDVFSSQLPCSFHEPHVANGNDEDDCESCNNDGHTIHAAGDCFGDRESALGIGVAIISAALQLPERATVEQASKGME